MSHIITSHSHSRQALGDHLRFKYCNFTVTTKTTCFPVTLLFLDSSIQLSYEVFLQGFICTYT